jgi:hypothetical protein
MCGWGKLEKRGLDKEGLNEFHISLRKNARFGLWRQLKRRVTEKNQDELQEKIFYYKYNLILFTFIYLENMEINQVFIPSIISSTMATIIIMVDFRTKIKYSTSGLYALFVYITKFCILV